MPHRSKQGARESRRRFYERNGDKVRRENRERRTANRERNRAYLRELKAATPCADCGGVFHWVVMDFDHLAEKNEAIAVLANTGATMERLLAEIALCELVCANCHRLRTLNRGWKGGLAAPRSAPSGDQLFFDL